MKRAVVIGAGIAGLAAALSLREHAKGAPFEIVILDKNPKPGGNIVTERADGFLIEGGPDCFLSEKPWAMELCKRLGLEHELLMTNDEFRKTFVYSRGALHELPEGVILMIPTKILPLAFSSLITFKGKFRMFMELFVPKKKDGEDESLASFVRRRLGQEALDKIAEPLVAGVHAGDPDTMSVRSSFPKFVQMEEEYGSLIKGMLKRLSLIKKGAAPLGERPEKVTMFVTLKHGLGVLVAEITKRLSGFENTFIKTGAGVEYVSAKRGSFEVVLKGNGSIEADAVIIAAPAYAASHLVKRLDPGISEKLLSIPYASTATISLGFNKKDIAHPMNGFGFVVPKIEKRRIMAATWVSRKFKYRAPEDNVLIRCFAGGAKDPAIVRLSDEELVKIARHELKEIMGIVSEPVLARVYKWINAMPQYTIGHEQRVSEIEALLGAHHGLYLTGSAYRGIGISDSIRNAEIAAKKALHHLSAA
ncbi:MAG: protoporphyrinogen oxidase [Deltaproteobacteria bacterium]|nr:protoporphyrinogen oxidase [Deltaproteobacteria bacterium]